VSATRLKPCSANALVALAKLRAYGEHTLGDGNWKLLWRFGKVMSGADAGQYVSGLQTVTAKSLIDSLLAGEVIEVHLMHEHCGGSREHSELALRMGRLVMFFNDRCEFASRIVHPCKSAEASDV